MRRTPVLIAAAAVLMLTACSSSTSKPTAVGTTSPASVASTATPAPSALTSSNADHTKEALECGMFDIGAVYLNDEWPAIIGGHPRFGYGVNLEQAADTWQKGLNSYSSYPSLDAAIGRAESGVHDMEAAMAQSTGSAPVEIGSEVRQIQDAFTVISGDCSDIGYRITQPLATTAS